MFFPPPLHLPVPVSAVRDGWDWLTIWCTVGATVVAVVAIVFAVVAIRRGDRNARDAQDALVQERRNVFELGVLVRLIEVCGTVEHGAGPVAAGLLRVLPPEDVPGFRAAVAQGLVPSNEALGALLPEYFAAVDRRLRDGEGEVITPPRCRRFRGRLRHPIRGA